MGAPTATSKVVAGAPPCSCIRVTKNADGFLRPLVEIVLRCADIAAGRVPSPYGHYARSGILGDGQWSLAGHARRPFSGQRCNVTVRVPRVLGGFCRCELRRPVPL